PLVYSYHWQYYTLFNPRSLVDGTHQRLVQVCHWPLVVGQLEAVPPLPIVWKYRQPRQPRQVHHGILLAHSHLLSRFVVVLLFVRKLVLQTRIDI
ncbi:hypothetical protein QHH11_26840, partial [Aphanizomenon sp. PH219]|nr:hypothetical protein [Aphanizomenon sp. PH219]